MIKHFEGPRENDMGDLASINAEALQPAVDQTDLFTGYNYLHYPKDKTVLDLFEEQVNRTPENIAIIFGDIELTYYELNQLSNRFGDYLRKTYNVKHDELIGIMLDRSEWMFIALLGVLKSGGGYVPIALDYPQDRIDYLIKDSHCKVLIDDIEIQRFKLSQDIYDSENYSGGLQPNHLMYCIYTSGSTGMPKGVLVEHKTVINLIMLQKKEFGITEDERLLQFSAISFDASVEQIWLSLLSGAGLVVINKALLTDMKALENYIIEKKVSHIHTVPAYLNELVISDRKHLKRILSGGDVCPPYLVKRYINDCDFYNKYGPTETTVTAIEYRAKKNDMYPDGFVPIGKPVANTHIYIFDEQQHAVPFGSMGEIYIGGDGVTRGYLNRPELTAERFIDDPFRPGERIYRTGDLGRWLPDGDIEYLGRTDQQVKISGFRIELGEISSVLQLHPKVKDAVVIAASVNGGDKELIAYTTGESDTFELKEYLTQHLPHYMIPAYYVQLPVLPLNKNGKIDRSALPLPTERYHQAQQAYAAPQSPTEEALINIWQNILNIERIGIDDNFFDLGGTSLMVIRTINQINNKTGASLRMAGLYQWPTVRQLAHQITTKALTEISPIVLLKQGKGIPLFIFPPWSSYPTIFNEFVKSYEADNPVYGIIYTEDTEHFPYNNVQEYVQYIVTHIKTIHPKGPYGLLGYSMGARTVFECALQLQRSNDTVAFLGAISHYPALPSEKLLLGRRLLDEIRVYWNINSSLKFKYLRYRFPYFVKLLLKGKNDIQEMVLEIDTQKKMQSIHETYSTREKYNGDVVLIYEKSPDGDISEFKKIQVYRNSIFKRLWKPYINGNVVLKNVETRHIDFFKQPAVKEVVKIAEHYLK